jgi:hypothetical protein
MGIVIITEIENKLQGTCDLNMYTMIYEGIKRERRASA